MELNKKQIKEFCIQLGADLVGIAAIERFKDTPEGFHPADIFPACKSVMVLCCKFPADAVNHGAEAYTKTRNEMTDKMNNLAAGLSKKVKSAGFECMEIGAINSSLNNGRYRGPISLKHAAMQAGLGKIGKNTLLVNDKYGNMIWLSAVLTSIPLESDPLANYEPCSQKCNLCVNNCPSSALGNDEMNQLFCYKHAFKTVNGKLEIQCWKCRQICPSHLGIKSK